MASSFETAQSDDETSTFAMAKTVDNARLGLSLQFQLHTAWLAEPEPLWHALFTRYGADLAAANYPPELATHLGREHMDALPHRFDERWVTRDSHKPSASLQRVALRASDLCGGELTLHRLHSYEDDYVLLLSDAHLRWPSRDDGEMEEETTHCTIAVSHGAVQCQRVTQRALDLTRFVRPGELCMVRARSTMTVRFGARSRCALWTPGRLRLELRSGALAFWCASAPSLFPLAWQMDSSAIAMQRDFLALITGQRALVSAEQRVHALHRLFDQEDALCDVGLDASGGMTLLAQYDRVCGRGWLRQHGTLSSDYEAERALMRSIQVLNRGDMWPEFYTQGRGGKRRYLSVMRHRYRGDNDNDNDNTAETTRQYYVNALYCGGRENIVAYFYLNLHENRLLLIPPQH